MSWTAQVEPATVRRWRAAASENRATPHTSLDCASASVTGSATCPVGPVTRIFFFFNFVDMIARSLLRRPPGWHGLTLADIAPHELDVHADANIARHYVDHRPNEATTSSVGQLDDRGRIWHRVAEIREQGMPHHCVA